MPTLLPIVTDDFTKTPGDPRRPKGFWRFMSSVEAVVSIEKIVIEVAHDLDITPDKRIIYRVFKGGGRPLPPPPPDEPTDPAQLRPVVQVIYPAFETFRDKSTEAVVPYNGVLQYETRFLEGYPMEILGFAYERIEIFLADANNIYLPDAKFDTGSVAVARFKAAAEVTS